MPGTPCHITQRGNNEQDVFFVDDDRRVYLELLQKSAQQFGLAVHGYCLMTNHVHLLATPVRARLVRLPWRYPWSSAAVHTGRAEPTGLLEGPQWRRQMSPKGWEEVLRGTDDEEMVRLLRIRTQTGRPLASNRFMSKVEAFLGRRVRPLPVGRPHGWRKAKTRGKGK